MAKVFRAVRGGTIGAADPNPEPCSCASCSSNHAEPKAAKGEAPSPSLLSFAQRVQKHLAGQQPCLAGKFATTAPVEPARAPRVASSGWAESPRSLVEIIRERGGR